MFILVLHPHLFGVKLIISGNESVLQHVHRYMYSARRDSLLFAMAVSPSNCVINDSRVSDTSSTMIMELIEIFAHEVTNIFHLISSGTMPRVCSILLSVRVRSLTKNCETVLHVSM